MLDIAVYRQSEELARQRVPSWRVSQIHNLDQFQNVGFPVRLASSEELIGLLDTMQENRFDDFMREFAGFTEAELALFLDVLLDFLRFHRAILPRPQLVLPLSTLIAQFAVYLKLRRYRGNFRTALEIGPGCGYLSLFMRRHASLVDYSQVEACESFYILQNRLNVFLFAERNRDYAGTDGLEGAERFFTTTRELEASLHVEAAASFQPPLCRHYPWWQLGKLAETADYFDVVTANANLLEMSPQAATDYLTVAHRVMRPDGILLAQDFGFSRGGTVAELMQKVMDLGLVPLYLGGGMVSLELAGQKCSRPLPLINALL